MNTTIHIIVQLKWSLLLLKIIDILTLVNKKDPKFKVSDHVGISKCKNIFAKGYNPSWSEEAFLIRRLKNTVTGTYVINDLNGEEIIGAFYGKNCKKQIKKNLELKKC